jgi:hypothetical protein
MTYFTEAPEELQVAIRKFWPEDQWDNAAGISYLESGWRYNAEMDSTQGGTVPCGTVIDTRNGVAITAEHSIGWFQINVCNYPSWDSRYLFNTEQNAGTAHMLWDERGWQPWYFSAQQLGLL